MYLHVLVCPKRIVKRFADLTAEEVSDIWLTAHKVAGKLEHHYKGTSLTFTIQVSSLLCLQSHLSFLFPVVTGTLVLASQWHCLFC